MKNTLKGIGLAVVSTIIGLILYKKFIESKLTSSAPTA